MRQVVARAEGSTLTSDFLMRGRCGECKIPTFGKSGGSPSCRGRLNTNMLFKVRNGALTHKDVKNEDRTDYIYENTGTRDKMYTQKMPLLHENAPISR